VTLVIMIAFCASSPDAAVAFGTIDSGGQNREHERITRAALSCAAVGSSDADCFEPKSMDSLAGHDRTFGGVGAPDSDELSLPAAHCDNADFLAAPEYPRSRDQATATVMGCLDQIRSRFDEGVASTNDLLDGQGNVDRAGTDLATDCKSSGEADGRSKCTSIEAFGRVLHGAQDFYAHSNWADEADPTRPIGPENPPGLNLRGPSPILDLRSDKDPDIPTDLTSGCFVLRDQVPGVGECRQRVTHAGLNKDRGLIDPRTGDTTNPTTPRGMVGDNFAKAVTGAIAETRRQWQDFRSEVTAHYGTQRGELMICALTHDDPVNDCTARSWGKAVGIVLVVGLGIAAAVVIMLQTRRRRRPSS
jgi:hypothetical protein